MALYTKQDFSPPILSRKWLAIKFRPNMLIYNRHHIISILESGLLFREDSIEVEQETPSQEEVWKAAGGGKGGWLTKGEGVVSLCAASICVAVFPPRSLQKSTFINLAAYATVPMLVRVLHRTAVKSDLAALLAVMRDYIALARRAAACLKEYAALHAKLGSISSVIESTRILLCRQQSELCVLMSRASSALLGNAPWMRSDVAWEAADSSNIDDLMKIHHAFLVVQSTFLKHIAMAHFIPSPHARKIYKNYNERIYWIHNVLITHLSEEFKQNFEALERMYRLLRNIGNNNDITVKKPGAAILNSWVYSDIQNGVAKTNLELKLASDKCNSLDVFLDSCALNKQDLDLDILAKDIDELTESITKCLTTIQHSQIRLKKIKYKLNGVKDVVLPENEVVNDDDVVLIDDKVPETKDEVFYFIKTEDETLKQTAEDVTTGPGKKERDTTKIVLSELKQKLGKREDVMRERERQALVKTMPEYKDRVPEFPRQIKFEEFLQLKGFITKLKRSMVTKRLFKEYKIEKKKKNKRYAFKNKSYLNKEQIEQPFYEANAKLSAKSELLTVTCVNGRLFLTKWRKYVKFGKKNNEDDSSGMSDGLSDEAGAVNKSFNEAVNVNRNNATDHSPYKFSKRDLELSESSDSDYEMNIEKQLELLKDARKHRAMRKKNHPVKKVSIDKDDESLKPIEYSFGTGMAMASVLQVNNKMRGIGQEEVFIGNGEVSNDSGNDEDA